MLWGLLYGPRLKNKQIHHQNQKKKKVCMFFVKYLLATKFFAHFFQQCPRLLSIGLCQQSKMWGKHCTCVGQKWNILSTEDVLRIKDSVLVVTCDFAVCCLLRNLSPFFFGKCLKLFQIWWSWTLVFSSPHRFSLGFESGFCTGQSVTFALVSYVVLHQQWCIFWVTVVLEDDKCRLRTSFIADCLRFYF